MAPISIKDATSRTVYLPAGDWWEYWKTEKLAGGREITANAALDSMPLYVRAGAIVPMGPVKQYTAEPTTEPTTLRIYPGANGRSQWYEDDGSSFEHERGSFMRILCEWDDSRRALTLTRDAAGSMTQTREIRVQLAGTAQSRSVSTKGSTSRVQF